MGIHLLAMQHVGLFFEDDQGVKLIRPYLLEADSDAQLQRRPEIEGAAQQ